MDVQISEFNIQEMDIKEMKISNGGDLGVSFALGSVVVILVFGGGIASVKKISDKKNTADAALI